MRRAFSLGVAGAGRTPRRECAKGCPSDRCALFRSHRTLVMVCEGRPPTTSIARATRRKVVGGSPSRTMTRREERVARRCAEGCSRAKARMREGLYERQVCTVSLASNSRHGLRRPRLSGSDSTLRAESFWRRAIGSDSNFGVTVNHTLQPGSWSAKARALQK